MAPSKKTYDTYTLNLIVVISSFVFSSFLALQNFQNIFTLSTPLGLGSSGQQLLATIQTTYFPPLIVSLVVALIMLTIIISVRIYFRKSYPSSIGYAIALVVTILEVIFISLLTLTLHLSQFEFSPVSVLQNAWMSPIIQLISLFLFGGSFAATLITIIDYRKQRSA